MTDWQLFRDSIGGGGGGGGGEGDGDDDDDDDSDDDDSDDDDEDDSDEDDGVDKDDDYYDGAGGLTDYNPNKVFELRAATDDDNLCWLRCHFCHMERMGGICSVWWWLDTLYGVGDVLNIDMMTWWYDKYWYWYNSLLISRQDIACKIGNQNFFMCAK